MKIAVLGTGRMGSGLARLCAQAGEDVIVGSRNAAKARALADEIAKAHPGLRTQGMDNAGAARAGEVIVLAVPYKEIAPLLRKLKAALKGKVVVDISNPLKPDFSGLTTRPTTSAAEEIAKLLGVASSVVGAFKNTFATLLGDPGAASPRYDVLVCGDDEKAKAIVVGLADRIGFRALNAGKLRAARTIEQMTVLMITMDVRYKGGFKSGWRFSG